MAPRRPRPRRGSRSSSPPWRRRRNRFPKPCPLLKKAFAAARDDAERRAAGAQPGAPHGRLAATAPAPAGLFDGRPPAPLAGDSWPGQGAGPSSPRRRQEPRLFARLSRRAEAEEREYPPSQQGDVAPRRRAEEVVKRLFGRLDLDADGLISRSEFAGFLKIARRSAAKGKLARVVATADGDGDMDLEKFTAALNAAAIEEEDLFRLCVADGNGTVPDAELAAAGRAGAEEAPRRAAGKETALVDPQEAVHLPRRVLGRGSSSPDDNNLQQQDDWEEQASKNREASGRLLAEFNADLVRFDEMKEYAAARGLPHPPPPWDREPTPPPPTSPPPPSPSPTLLQPQSGVPPPPPPPTTSTFTVDHAYQMFRVLNAWSRGEPVDVLVSEDLPVGMAKDVRDLVFYGGGQERVINPQVLGQKIYQAQYLRDKIAQAERDIARCRHLLELP